MKSAAKRQVKLNTKSISKKVQQPAAGVQKEVIQAETQLLKQINQFLLSVCSDEKSYIDLSTYKVKSYKHQK